MNELKDVNELHSQDSGFELHGHADNESIDARICREGKAMFANQSNDVFYNSAQVFNRDLSIIVLKCYSRLLRNERREKAVKKSQENTIRDGESSEESSTVYRGLNVLEPLAATGLRSLRYCLEVGEEIDSLLCGDIDPIAVSHIKQNRSVNRLSSSKIKVTCADAVDLLNCVSMKSICPSDAVEAVFDANESYDSRPNRTAKKSTKKCSDLNDDEIPFGCEFDVIDIDPYGSVAKFLDAAVRAVKPGGLLCLTSTDMMVLCGKQPEVSFYKYGGNPVNSKHIHEMSLRILLHTLTLTASRYQKVAVPLMSCSVDFYVRLFVRIYDSPLLSKSVASRTGLIHQCVKCGYFSILPFGKILMQKSAAQEKSHSRDTTFNELKTKLTNSIFKASTVPNDSSGSCCQCNGNLTIGGPIYIGPLHDKKFVNLCIDECHAILLLQDAAKYFVDLISFDFTDHKIGLYGDKNGTESSKMTISAILADKSTGCRSTSISTADKILGVLVAIQQELDVPLFMNVPSLCQTFGIEMIRPIVLKSALHSLGYKSSAFHRDPQGVKTDAPIAIIFDVIRDWIQKNNIDCSSKSVKRLGVNLSQKESSLDSKVDFSVNESFLKNEPSILRLKGSMPVLVHVPKWLPNEPNCGPGSKPKGNRSKREFEFSNRSPDRISKRAQLCQNDDNDKYD